MLRSWEEGSYIFSVLGSIRKYFEVTGERQLNDRICLREVEIENCGKTWNGRKANFISGSSELRPNLLRPRLFTNYTYLVIVHPNSF